MSKLSDKIVLAATAMRHAERRMLLTTAKAVVSLGKRVPVERAVDTERNALERAITDYNIAKGNFDKLVARLP